MPEQYLSTSRLGNVIQLIALGKQTGVLKATRGQGSTREHAEVHFADGQPVFASLGQLVGNAALSVLQNWGESQYIFLEGPLPQTEPPAPASEPPRRTGELAPPPPGVYPSRLGPRVPPITERQETNFPSFTAPLPPTPGFHTENNANGAARTTGNLAWGRGNDTRSGSLPGPSMRRESFQGHFVPRRLAPMDHLDALPLDRRERMVLLLVDGRRSLTDLVRLTRRNEQELQAILVHLAALGLIE